MSGSCNEDDDKRVCFMHPGTGQMLTGNRAPRRPETIRKYLAEGWIPMTRDKRPLGDKRSRVRKALLPAAPCMHTVPLDSATHSL